MPEQETPGDALPPASFPAESPRQATIELTPPLYGADAHTRGTGRQHWEMWIPVAVAFVFGFSVTRAVLGRHANSPQPKQHVEQLTANSFTVIDAKGRTRGQLVAADNGAAGLGLFDAEGHKRLEYAVLSDGRAGLDLKDEQGRSRLLLGSAVDGTPCLALADENGIRKLSIGITSQGIAGLDIYDEAGQLRAGIGTVEDGSPVLAVIDASGRAHLLP
jgi:hypothetical protein